MIPQILKTGQQATLEVHAWAIPAEGITLDELVEEFKQLGNPILKVDYEKNAILTIHVKQEGLLG